MTVRGIDAAAVPRRRIEWNGARRIIRSRPAPIDLFEDIADPADWPLLISAERKTDPRRMMAIGALDLIPTARRREGPDADLLMAPFAHRSPDRPSRFDTGAHGVLHVAATFATALFEAIHHHQRFMARTAEPPGWTAQFREIVLDVAVDAHDLRDEAAFAAVLDRDDYTAAQRFGRELRAAGSDGLVYPSRRRARGNCVALFYPDGASNAVEGRQLACHWDGTRVDHYREPEHGAMFRIDATA